MLVLQSVGVVVLLLVCAFDPGFFFVRRLRWSAMEKLCGAIALSLIFLWLAGWAIFVSGVDWRAAYAIPAIALGMAAVGLRDFLKLLRSIRFRRALFGFAFLLGWTVLALVTIRHYSGAGWSGDWVEQFHRTMFYLHRFPKDTLMFGGYPAPARPPMANILCAIFLAQTADRFELFQLVYSVLNLLPFLACCLIAPALARPRRGWMFVLVAVFAMSPLFMQNATYAWTKSLSAFCVITALHFCLTGRRKNDPVRMVFGFTVLAAGLLVHYSAGPYCVILGLLYLVLVWAKRPARGKELALIAGGVGVLLLTWFGWSFANYGVAKTFSAPADTSVNYGVPKEGSTLGKIAGNLFDSIVPHVLRDSALMHSFDQPNAEGYVRDNAFIVYQSTIVCAMGSIGGIVAIWFLVRRFRRKEGGSEPRFWLLLIGLIVAAGFAVIGERDRLGGAQLTLAPLLLLGITFLALHFRESRVVAVLIVAGLAIDFGLGVLVQERVEHLENTERRTVFTGLVMANGTLDIGTPGEYSLNQTAWGNWYRKHQVAASEKWLRDLAALPASPAVDSARNELRPNLEKAVADDASLWKGWYRGHGGEMTFLGDHFGDSEIASWMLVAIAGGLLWKTLGSYAPLGRPEAPLAGRGYPTKPHKKRR